MVHIPVFWTEYTATMHGRIFKVVPCENCSTEYVYLMKRKGSGYGTSMYMLNDEAPKITRNRLRKTHCNPYWRTILTQSLAPCAATTRGTCSPNCWKRKGCGS